MKFDRSLNAKLLFKAISVESIIVVDFLLSSFQKTIVSNRVERSAKMGDTAEKFSYSYDTLGRLIAFGTKRTYDYSVRDSIIIYDLNSKGRKSRVAWLIDTSGHLLRGLNVRHTYDRQGFLIESEYDLGAHCRKEVYTISNGDRTKSEFFDDGKLAGTTKFTYYNTEDNRDYGKPFRGRRSLHLLKTETELYNDSVIQSTYTYSFDNFGRVISETISSPNGNRLVKGIHTWAYTYQE